MQGFDSLRPCQSGRTSVLFFGSEARATDDSCFTHAVLGGSLISGLEEVLDLFLDRIETC